MGGRVTEQLQKNIFKIYMFDFFCMFLVIMPVIVPIFSNLGLNMEKIFLLQGIFGGTVALFEVPSGYMSDMWGRKKTLIVGAFLFGLGFTIMIFARGFWSLLLYEVVVGIGISLMSGTDLALLWDTIDSLKGEFSVAHDRAVANLHFIRLLAEAIAAILGGILVTYSFHHVVVGNAIVMWIPFFVACTLVEPPKHVVLGANHRDNFKTIYNQIVKKNPFVRLLFLNTVTWGLGTFFAVWCLHRHWQMSNIKLENFGYLWALFNLVGGISGQLVSRMKPTSKSMWLIFAALLIVLSYFMMGAYLSLIGVFFGMGFYVARGINFVIFREWINKQFDSQFRATVNSVVSLGVRGVFFFAGPLIGFIIDRYSLQIALYGLSVFYLASFFIILRPLLVNKQNIYMSA